MLFQEEQYLLLLLLCGRGHASFQHHWSDARVGLHRLLRLPRLGAPLSPSIVILVALVAAARVLRLSLLADPVAWPPVAGAVARATAEARLRSRKRRVISSGLENCLPDQLCVSRMRTNSGGALGTSWDSTEVSCLVLSESTKPLETIAARVASAASPSTAMPGRLCALGRGSSRTWRPQVGTSAPRTIM